MEIVIKINGIEENFKVLWNKFIKRNILKPTFIVVYNITCGRNQKRNEIIKFCGKKEYQGFKFEHLRQ